MSKECRLGWRLLVYVITVYVLSMTLNCQVLYSTPTMNQLDQNYNADLLDAMADMAYEQKQAMRESNQSEWTLVENNDNFIGFNVTNQESEWEGVIYDDEDAS
jgi:hypothetical protein